MRLGVEAEGAQGGWGFEGLAGIQQELDRQCRCSGTLFRFFEFLLKGYLAIAQFPSHSISGSTILSQASRIPRGIFGLRIYLQAHTLPLFRIPSFMVGICFAEKQVRTLNKGQVMSPQQWPLAGSQLRLLAFRNFSCCEFRTLNPIPNSQLKASNLSPMPCVWIRDSLGKWGSEVTILFASCVHDSELQGIQSVLGFWSLSNPFPGMKASTLRSWGCGQLRTQTDRCYWCCDKEEVNQPLSYD